MTDDAGVTDVTTYYAVRMTTGEKTEQQEIFNTYAAAEEAFNNKHKNEQRKLMEISQRDGREFCQVLDESSPEESMTKVIDMNDMWQLWHLLDRLANARTGDTFILGRPDWVSGREQQQRGIEMLTLTVTVSKTR